MNQELKCESNSTIMNALKIPDALGRTSVGIALNTTWVEFGGAGVKPADDGQLKQVGGHPVILRRSR
jgi:hypothetical protein